jgi:SAM-dependent methyltransferase
VGDEQWQVAGSAAEVYERELVPAIFGPWAPRMVGLAALAAGERVLDVACGTGVVARLAAEHVGPAGRVVGLDLNPGMLAVARSLPVAGVPVGWVQATAGRLPFPDGSFEVVCCQLGLQFFPDRAAALAEMARVLVPGGRLVVMVWRSIDHSPGFAVLAGALDRHVGLAAGALMRAPFGLGDEGKLRGLVEGAGFGEVGVDRQAGVVRFGSAGRWWSPTGLGRRWPGRSGPPGRPPGRGWWPRSRPRWSRGRARRGWPSRSRRCWSAAARSAVGAASSASRPTNGAVTRTASPRANPELEAPRR